jgi:hypothetical protein
MEREGSDVLVDSTPVAEDVAGAVLFTAANDQEAAVIGVVASSQ